MMLDLAMRWVHIVSAIILVGGTVFLRCVMHPTLQSLSSDARTNALAVWRPAWARLVMMTSGLLLLTGLHNAVANIQRFSFPDAPYHVLVAAKLLVAMGLFALSAITAGRSGAAERSRQNLATWLNLQIVLALVLVGLGSFMKVVRHEPKPSSPPAVTEKV